MIIDIVVPVFNAAALLRRCLAALDRHTPPEQAQLLLIDDASPDPGIQTLLADWQANSPLRPTLLLNPENLGFVGTVNRAFSCTDNDVLLLNADTEVTPGWLDRMTAALRSYPRISTVTPFTTNAYSIS